MDAGIVIVAFLIVAQVVTTLEAQHKARKLDALADQVSTLAKRIKSMGGIIKQADTIVEQHRLAAHADQAAVPAVRQAHRPVPERSTERSRRSPAERPVREPAERQDAALKWEYHAENGADRSYFTATVTDQVVAWVIETDSGAGHAIAYLANPNKVRLTPIQLLNGVDEAKTWAETRAQKFTRTAELPQQSE